MPFGNLLKTVASRNTMETQTKYSSQAKLLLTAEYAVKQGAEALVLPLKARQYLTITSKLQSSERKIHWVSEDIHGVWFYADFQLDDLKISDTNNREAAAFLQNILKTSAALNPGFFQNKPSGIELYNKNEFDRNWGWGSSSALIANIAKWMGTDAFLLHQAISKGSGYDVVAANAHQPFLYKLLDRSYAKESVALNFPFSDQLFFFYQGKKEDSETGIRNFLKNKKSNKNAIDEISQISRSLLNCTELKEFIDLMRQHEDIIAHLTGFISIQKRLFADFDGIVKSLGAWGGDFGLIASEESPDYIINYLKAKGFPLSFSWEEIVL